MTVLVVVFYWFCVYGHSLSLALTNFFREGFALYAISGGDENIKFVLVYMSFIYKILRLRGTFL